MARAPLFGVFILALCIVACVCANAEDAKETAKAAAVAVQESAKNVLEKVTAENKKALQLLKDIETYKQNAEAAAAEAEKASKDNKDAAPFAQKAREASNELIKLYPDASKKAKDIVDKMKTLLTEATALNNTAKEIVAGAEKNTENTKTQTDNIKTKAGELDKKIDTEKNPKPDTDLLQKKTKMADFAKTAQLEKYRVDGVVAVSKIETLIKTAESDFKLTEKKKEEIAATVQEIKKLVDTSPKGLSPHISGLLLSAEGELKFSSDEVEKAKKAKEYIPEQQKRAEDALVKLKAAKEVEKAKSEAGIAQTAAIMAENKVEEIKEALKSAATFATNALDRKHDVEDVISEKTKIPDVTQDKNKVNPQDATGGPASGDSAMTVSVPLLMVLIACAFLQ